MARPAICASVLQEEGPSSPAPGLLGGIYVPLVFLVPQGTHVSWLGSWMSRRRRWDERPMFPWARGEEGAEECCRLTRASVDAAELC